MATDGADKNRQGQEAEEVEVQEAETTEEEVERVEMTHEEYEAALQKEADRRVSQALKKREAEFSKRLEKEKAEARKEAEELAKLSESERAKVEKEKEEMRLTKEREELQKERAEFERERLHLQAEKELVTRSLPADFAPYILGEDADDTFERISTFEEKWQQALDAAIQDRLKSKSPKLGAGKKKLYTKAEVEAMSRDELLANEDAITESMKHWR